MPCCGVCRAEKQRGLFFHACDDWLHLRLFVCSECGEAIAVQRTAHELCYECVQDVPDSQLAALSPVSHFHDLVDAIRAFERSHARLFAVLPATEDASDAHPGSLHPECSKWCERHGIVPRQQ